MNRMRLNRDFGTISLEKEFLCAVFEGIFIVLLREIRRLLLLNLEGCTLNFLWTSGGLRMRTGRSLTLIFKQIFDFSFLLNIIYQLNHKFQQNFNLFFFSLSR